MPADPGEIIAAYAAGEDIKQIERRFGVPEDTIIKIIKAETAHEAGSALESNAAGARKASPLTVAGVVLTVLGLVGPCMVGVLWLSIFYLSGGDHPARSWGYWNLVAGASGIVAGSILTIVGVILLLAARIRR